MLLSFRQIKKKKVHRKGKKNISELQTRHNICISQNSPFQEEKAMLFQILYPWTLLTGPFFSVSYRRNSNPVSSLPWTRVKDEGLMDGMNKLVKIHGNGYLLLLWEGFIELYFVTQIQQALQSTQKNTT